MAESEGLTTSAVANSNRTHISQSKNGVNGSDKPHKRVVIFDCRPERHDAMERVLDINVTIRYVVDMSSLSENLQQGNTLHLLQTEDQILPVATKEHIVFLPHYDTLVQSGMYEYYASEGQNSLPYAFAELIDNALSATSRNTGVRTIDIRLLFDESLGKHAVVIMDNGCGMTSKQLNNWAVYRLSKFSRESGTFSSDHAGYVRPDPVARSLNSDISYFGVGGKQAVFYIGQSTRMITKPAGSPDVHELIISKEEFERKEDYSQITQNVDVISERDDEERFLHGLIAEEVGKDSFTAVVVTGVQPEHVTFLKQDFHLWTRELAHLYHYYIHGLNGNDMKASYRNSDCVSNIDIQISLLEKFPKIPRMVNLREIDNDMQTLYINTSADTFEFKACTDVDGIVEGVLRYHPFLYDRETYPEDPYAIPATEEDDDSIVMNQARGKRPIFECFWNGRLIPYTTVSEFDWCAWPKKTGTVPAECYSRFSGVLFTNDRFQVSTNKLTFMDLELQLKNKETLFTRIVNGQEQRVKIHKEFHQWLKTCHEKWDKQVKFRGFKRTITRTDVTTKKMQSPWATFSSIEWDGRAYKAGQYVKSQKTQPIFFGSVIQFLLYGDHEGDVYATGGQVQVEPKALYDDIKTIPISKIDRVITNAAIKKSIDDELAKLPDKLKVTWPEGNPWTQNDVRPAGTPLGPLHVEILNKKGESISRIPSAMQNTTRKALSIELKVVWHSPNGDVETNSHIAAHSAKWAFWFRTMENLNKLGKYTLHLNTILNVNESNATVWAGNQLPNHTLDFSITEGSAERFVVGTVNTLLHVGVPFNIPLELLDEYGHPARPTPNLKPLLELVLPGLKQDSQTLKISLLPGNPDSLKVKQEDPITVENGTSVSFDVEVHDVAGNVTAHPKLIISCQGIPGSSSMVAVDCSNTGAGTLVLKPITFKNIAGDQTVKATFDIPSQKSVAPVQRDLRVVPSTRVSRLEVYSQEDEDSLVDSMVLRDKEKIDWTAGDLLENLHYRLYDERGRVVPLSEEMARRIKVNWAADVSVEELAQGKLPNVPVPTLVKEEHFYQVSYMEELVSVDTSFTIVPRPDEPKHMKATLSESTVRMGEVLSGKIFLQLTDQYGNKTQMLTATCVDSLAVDAEGLDKASLVFTWQESTHSMLVTGVRFNPGLPGIRELNFTWRDFAEHVTIKLTAGVPAQLKLVDGPQEPLQVLNEQGIQTPFLLQLFDEWGNPSPDQRVVVTLKTSTPALKVSHFTNVKGTWGFYSIGDIDLCWFRGSFNKKPIHGPAVKLTIIPDPNKPVKLVVEYNTNSVFPAGGTLTVFSVSVVSEEGSTIKNLNPANMSMLLWKGEPSGTSRPPSGVSYGTPRLHPKWHPIAYIVQRVPILVIIFLWLMVCVASLQDMYNNSAGLELSGKVVVTIKSSKGSSDKNLPLFEGKVKSLQFSLANGEAQITNLFIMENSPGQDGNEYVLLFRPSVPGYGPKNPLAAFELPFRFYNDVENRKQMSELTKKKDQLKQTVDIYRSLFDTNRQLITELSNQVRNATNKESHLKSELGKNAIDKVIGQKTADAEKMKLQTRRVCAMPDPFRGNLDVLGKIGHLALVEDDDVATVISWHLLGDIDCVVTMTTVAARKIYDDTQGKQQVMPLDTVFWRKNSSRPLPHIRNGQDSFRPIGNPVFARDLLIFPENAENCHIVFGNLLGDTILTDDLDSANHYRKGVVQSKVPCPTLLTRQGDRIRSNGKFGGLQNKAPPIERLRGQVFGAPLPKDYHTFIGQIDLLQQYRLAMEKSRQVQEDFDGHMQYLKSPEMVQKEEEMDEQEKQLKDIETKLGTSSTPVRTPSAIGVKRSLDKAGESSGMVTKRTRRKLLKQDY
uniref:Structural maintenance of chromosomes flexible hinge domain containing 1 n=1 Tax=Oncorhynchus kisutch TaxID=8019 RepID=A0A8C7KKK5_ONCKI